MGRAYSTRVECAHEGCTEVAHFESRTRKEQHDTYARYFKKWRCIRHSQPDEVLSQSNLFRSMDMAIFEESYGRFWGVDKAASGFAHGPGFKAFAKDFPSGTVLRVTAEIILPDPTEPKP